MNFYFIPLISKLIQVNILFCWLEINIKKKKDLIFTASKELIKFMVIWIKIDIEHWTIFLVDQETICSRKSFKIL